MTLNPHETVTGNAATRTLQEPARLWFEALRDRLCAAFEAIEGSEIRTSGSGRPGPDGARGEANQAPGLERPAVERTARAAAAGS